MRCKNHGNIMHCEPPEIRNKKFKKRTKEQVSHCSFHSSTTTYTEDITEAAYKTEHQR